MNWTLDRCGVYFLFLHGKLQYIGQSQDFYIRCKQHKSNGLFYDHVEFKPYRIDELLEMERIWIEKYRPPLNRQKMPKVKRYKGVAMAKTHYNKKYMKLRKLTEKSTVGFGSMLYTRVSAATPLKLVQLYFQCSHITFFDDVLDRIKIAPEWRFEKPGVATDEFYYQFLESVYPKEMAAKSNMKERSRFIAAKQSLKTEKRLTNSPRQINESTQKG